MTEIWYIKENMKKYTRWHPIHLFDGNILTIVNHKFLYTTYHDVTPLNIYHGDCDRLKLIIYAD